MTTTELSSFELFEGLPPASRKSLDAFARFESVPPGEAFIRQGEYTGDFYFILSGVVSAYRVESDGTRRSLGQMGPGDWFGELSALSNQPSPAKLQADTPAVVVMLEAGLFKELYTKGKTFRARIDERYRERSLALHLRIVPILKDLGDEAIARLQRVARFETYAADTVVARPGEAVDALYLVRNGAVVAARGEGVHEELSGYFMTNASFGEQAFLGSGGTWEQRFTTMMTSEVLALPVDETRAALADVPGALTELENAVRRAREEDASSLDEIDAMVRGQSVKGGEALVIDLERCVRCNACVESCVAVHDDHVPRLSKKGNRIPAESNKLGKTISLVTSCYSCATPGCMLACSYGAIRRDRQGLVRFIWDNCVGCAMCVSGCPYDVIRLTPPPDQEAALERKRSALGSLPVVGGFLKSVFGAGGGVPAPTEQRQGYHKDVESKGKAVKCDRCEGLPFEACVYNCPTAAISRMNPAVDIFGQAANPEGGR